MGMIVRGIERKDFKKIPLTIIPLTSPFFPNSFFCDLRLGRIIAELGR
jgi:hypothetical protein